MQQLRSCNRQLQIDIDCLTKEIDLFQARGTVCLSASATVNVDFFFPFFFHCLHVSKVSVFINDEYRHYVQNHHISLSETMGVIIF